MTALVDPVEVCNAARMEVGLPPTAYADGLNIGWTPEASEADTKLAHRAAMLGFLAAGDTTTWACYPCWSSRRNAYRDCQMPVAEVLQGRTCERHQP